MRDSIPTIEPGGLFTSFPVDGIATTSTNSPGHQYNIHVTAALSPTFLIDGGYGYSYGAILSQQYWRFELQQFSGCPVGARQPVAVHQRPGPCAHHQHQQRHRGFRLWAL